MDPILTISREIFLRPLRPHEAGALYSLVESNRAHLRQWLPWVDSTRNPVDSRKFLEINYAATLRGSSITFGIRYKGKLAGVIGFHGFDRINRVTSLGYWLGKDYCGKGIMRQSVERCVAFAFEEQDMNRLYIRCATENIRSQQVAKSLGFVFEGIQREAEWLYTRFVDLEVYSVLASDWTGGKSRS